MGDKNTEDQEYRRSGMLGDEFYDDDEKLSTDADAEDEEHTDDDSNENADEEHGDQDTSDEDTDGDDDGGNDDDGDDDNEDDGGDDDAVTARFKELGLDGKYASVEDALNSIPHANATITKADQDKSELMKLLVASRQQLPTAETVEEKALEIDAEEFLDDPVKALTKLGLLGKKEEPVDVNALVQSEVQQQRAVDRTEANYQKFVSETKDLDKMMPIMKVIYKENPSMSQLPLDEGTRVLYQLAKARAGQSTSAKGKKNTDEAVDDKRSRANTSSNRNTSSKKRRGKVRTEADLHKMSERELENWVNSQGE